MADFYIDIAEMRRYGDHFVSAAAPYLSLNGYVAHLVATLQSLQSRVASITTGKQDSASTSTTSHKAQRAHSDEIRTRLDSLFTDLKAAEKKGITFNFSDFFPTSRLSDIGGSIADRKVALERCVNALKNNPTVPEAATWQGTVEDLLTRVTDAVSTASSSDSSRSEQYKAFMALRPQWRQTYLACKRGMESVLLLEGRQDEFKALFLDLQKGGSSGKQTSTPDAEKAKGEGSGVEGAGAEEGSARGTE